jgi:glycosyltransferase involved in cell wall biosynthesis
LNVGGPAIHTVLLTQLLNPQRFASTLVIGKVSPSEGDMGYLAQEKGVEPYVIPELGREIHWRNDPIVLWKLFRFMRHKRPTIVHTHTAKAGMLGRFAAKLAGVPIVVHTFHGHVFHGYFSPLKTKIFLGIERFLAKFTNAIVTVSPKQREEILNYGIGHPAKVHAIDLGLELRRFVEGSVVKGGLRQELGIGPESPLVGIVGRLVPVKNHRLFLDAAQQILAQIPDVHFAILGDGELRDELQRYAADLKIASQVHFLGFRPNSPELFVDLDVVALSSLNEGTPVTLIEAMAAGKPVVTTDVGGVSDVVTHDVTGFLVPSQNNTALAKALQRMLSLTAAERSAMGLAGRQHVYPKYDISTLTYRIEQLYASLL